MSTRPAPTRRPPLFVSEEAPTLPRRPTSYTYSIDDLDDAGLELPPLALTLARIPRGTRPEKPSLSRDVEAMLVAYLLDIDD
jgi:hypothetical protein